MTLLDQTILALINYRKRNGYIKTIKLCACGLQATRGDYCRLCAKEIPL